MTPRFGAQTIRRMGVPWPELGKAVGTVGLGRNTDIHFRVLHLLRLLASKWRCAVSNWIPESEVWEKGLTREINQELLVCS